MFDIGFPELLLVGIVGLLVLGPERLPEALRTLGLWLGRMRRSFTQVKAEIEKEIGMDDIRRQLHNEAVMEEMKRIEREVRDSVNEVSQWEQGPVPRRVDDSGKPLHPGAAAADQPAADPAGDPADGHASADAPAADTAAAGAATPPTRQHTANGTPPDSHG
jgi:sec-independent protein translocase protein TatB